MSDAPDPITALVSFLAADAGVAAHVGARVFGGEVDEDETPSMPRKAIVVQYAGGLGAIGNGYQQYGDPRIDVLSYGAIPFEAAEVWNAVLPALKQLRREMVGDCLLHWAKHAGGPLPLREPDTDWPLVLSTWQVLAAQVAAA